MNRSATAEMRASMKVEPGVWAMYAVATKEQPQALLLFDETHSHEQP